MERKPILGISMGDPAGIGPEIIVKALKDKKVKEVCLPVVFGSYDVFRRFSNLKINLVFSFQRKNLKENCFNLCHCTDLDFSGITSGKLSFGSAQMAVNSLLCAIEMAKRKKFDALVTAPLSKEGLRMTGYDFPGHTELLAFLTNAKNFGMMFLSENFKIILVTTHLPLKKVSQVLTPEKILDKIKLAHTSLKNLFKIKNPKIAVTGLNPHSGEKGVLGDEEMKIIIPAIKKALKQKMDVFGPIPADALFTLENAKKFDCFVAMYHDQGLIPAKLFGFGTAVNVTVGLPFIRTSPDHGTAWDIAGKNLANPKGMINALLWAVRLAKLKRE